MLMTKFGLSTFVFSRFAPDQHFSRTSVLDFSRAVGSASHTSDDQELKCMISHTDCPHQVPTHIKTAIENN